MKLPQIFKDSFVTLVGNGLGKALAFVSGIFVARFLGSEVFGQYSVVRNSLFSIAVFSTFGLGYTSTKFVAEYYGRKEFKSVSGIISIINIVFSFLFAVLVFIFSDFIAKKLNIIDLDYAIRMLAFIVLFNAITTTQIGVLSGMKAFKQLAVNNVLSGLITFALSIYLTYFYALRGALWALLVSQVFNSVINLISEIQIARKQPGFFKWDWTIFYKIFKFSIPVTLQESIYAFSGWMILYILTNWSSLVQVAYFSAVTQWINLVMFVPAAIRGVILSYFSSNEENVDERSLFINTTKITLFSSALPTIMIIIFSSIIISFYGEGFNEMRPVLIVGILSSLFNSVAGVYNQAYIAKGRNWTIFFISFFREALYISSSFLLLTKTVTCEGGALCVVSCFTISIAFSLFLYFISDLRHRI